MTIPILTQGQYAVLKAEYATGIVLQTNNQRYNGTGKVYEIFDSYEQAKSFALEVVAKQPDIESWVQDSTNTHVFFCNKEGSKNL